MSLEVVNDSILNSPEGEEYAGPDMTAEAGNAPRDSGIGPLPPSASTSGGEYRLPSDLLKPPSSREADEDEEDDDIVATLPIYLHHSLAPSLTQFQYPLQHRNLRVPTWAEERGKKITARVKEQSGRVDVEVPIDADPKVCSANKWGCEATDAGGRWQTGKVGWGKDVLPRRARLPLGTLPSHLLAKLLFWETS